MSLCLIDLYKTLKMLSVKCQNKFGNLCYIENPDGDIKYSDLQSNVIWTIENPSSELLEMVESEEHIIETYNGVTYLTTKFAKSKFPTTSNGSACVIRLRDDTGKMWFMLVSDNKHYIQNCCGGSLSESESPSNTMIRELQEELNICVSSDRLKIIGSWGFMNVNPVINLNKENITTLFMIDLNMNDISHLCTTMHEEDYFVINANDLECKLDEVEHIYFVSQDFMKKLDLPEKINNKLFKGHHIDILKIISGVQGNYEYPYLSHFCCSCSF